MSLILRFDFDVQNVEVLKDEDAVKQLGNILKTNVRACKALGHPYVVQVSQKIVIVLIWNVTFVEQLISYKICFCKLPNANVFDI